MRSVVLVAVVLTIASATRLAAQAPADTAGWSPRCQGAEFRQFDFWVGTWEVRGADGTVFGRNTIERDARGCALVERWRGAQGGTGVSVNTYDTALMKWTQRWVGDGATLWLEGGLEDGRMVLRGTAPRSTPRGAVLDRITWSPLPDGRVQQLWETSTDGGATWQQSFSGFYSRLSR